MRVIPYHSVQMQDLKTQIKDVMADLVVIEEQVKIHPKTNHDHNNSNKMQLKNPCHVHNGSHEWDDCHQNPKKN